MLRRILGTYGEAFGELPRPVWLLSAITLIHRSGTMVVPFLTLYLTAERGMSVATAGRYLALYGIGGVVGAVVGGRLTERLGSVRAMQSTLAVAGCGFIVLATAEQPAAIALVLLITSAAAEGFRTPSSAALGLAAPPSLRARAFALRRLAINLGMSIGPAAGGLLATFDYRWLFVVDGLTCLLAAVGVTLWMKADRPPSAAAGAAASASPPRPRIGGDRILVAVLGCTMLMHLAFAQLFGTYPLTLKRDFGYGEAWVGLLLATNTVLIVLFEMVLIHRLSSRRPLRVIAAGALAQAIAFVLVPYDPRLAFAFLAITVLTVGEMLTLPVIEGFVANRVPASALGRAMGMLTACFAIVFVIAPVIGTAVYGAFGYRVLWLGCAGVAVLASLGFAWVDRRDRGPVSGD